MRDDVFMLAAVDTLDQAELNIRHPKTNKPTGWVWTFYGPAHPVTVALADQVSRDAFRKAAEQRQARINGKPWAEDEDRSLDQVRAENIEAIVTRTRTFTPVNLDGKTVIEFSVAAARELLSDRRKGWLLAQVIEFLGSEVNFIQPSAQG